MVTEKMASQTLSGMLRKWRRDRRGEWKWLLLAIFTLILFIFLTQTDDLTRHEVRVHFLELPAGGDAGRSAEWSDIFNNFTFLEQRVPVKEATHRVLVNEANLLARLRHYEGRVMDSYVRVQLAVAESSGTTTLSDGPALVDVGTLRDLRSFRPLLTAREKARLLYVFDMFDTACQLSRLSYFLLDTSLVGSVRHHGIVPWTDFTISVGMRREDQGHVLHVLDNLAGLTLIWPNPYEWSLRLRDTKPDPPDLVRGTFVHIHFYRENSTHIWGETWGAKRTFTAPRERVFPLVSRPFEGRLVPAPCDVTAVVGEEVGVCRVMAEDEWEMEWRDAGHVPCAVLSQVFPFVTRRVNTTSRFVTEQMYVNGTLLYSLDVQPGCSDRADDKDMKTSVQV
nr:hypothetical protein BaRGS_017013 [Batillaria attramentaria]